MTTFVQAPFWALRSSGRILPHATSVLVQPAVVVVSSSIAASSVITTVTPHYFVTGDTALVAGHTGSTPSVNGSYVVTAISATTFSIPLTVTVGGTGGTVTRTASVEPLTLAQGLLAAGFDWSSGDAREPLMTGWIAAARSKVEQDTGLAMLTQVRDVYFDAIYGAMVQFPDQCVPLQAVTSISSTDTSGVVNVLDVSNYHVDTASGRIGLSLSGSWPSDLRPFQPIVVRVVAGYTSVAAIPALLMHAVRLLTAHYATAGRDLATAESMTEMPYGYCQAIESFQRVTLA